MKKKSGIYVKRLRMAVKNKKNRVKYSQLDLANDLGFTRSYIAQLETDERDISLSTFLNWMLLFDIEQTKIFYK